MSKHDRGFASMHPDKVRVIAGMGGRAAHAKGTAHKWNTEEARAAGRKGGNTSARRKDTPGDARATGDTPNDPE